jgi:hypothetical protein
MTVPKPLTGALALAATTASLASPAMASVKAGDSTFQQTYPVASRVCTEVLAGKRKHLQRFRTRVLADCTLLETGFTAAQSAVLAARASISAAIAADRAAITTACPAPPAGRPACESTRRSQQLAITALQLQQVAAARVYYRTIETNRRRFWSAIRALPGERHLRGDSPIAQQNS